MLPGIGRLGGRRLHDLLAAAAGLLGTREFNDLELCRDHLDDLAQVLTDKAQFTSAIRAGAARI